MSEIKKNYFYINEQNAAIACSVFEEKCQELLQNFLQDLKINFPPRRVSNLMPRLIELVNKLNMLGLLCTLRQNGKLDSPFEQQALLQELEKKNIGYEHYLEKKAEALQDSINKQKELVQELMEMSKIGHEKLMEAMLMDFDKMLESYHKLDLLRQEIERLEKQLELIREQLQVITQKLTEITGKFEASEKRLVKIHDITNELLQLPSQLQIEKTNLKRKYEEQETIQDYDAVDMKQLIDAIVEREINPSPKNEENYQRVIKVISDSRLVIIEEQEVNGEAELVIAKQTLVDLQAKLTMTQDSGQPQEKITALIQEITDEIAAAEEKKIAIDERIKKRSNKKIKIKEDIANLEKLIIKDPGVQKSIENLNKITNLGEVLKSLTKDEDTFDNEKIGLTKLQESLISEKIKLEQQQKDINIKLTNKQEEKENC